MLFPREFANRYGLPVPVRVAITSASDTRIPPDPDRYLIVFWAIDNTQRYTVTPDVDTSLTMGTFDVGPGGQPIIFTHILHGSLVNLGWRVRLVGPGVDQSAPVLIGRMPVTIPTGVSDNGETTYNRTINRNTRGRTRKNTSL